MIYFKEIKILVLYFLFFLFAPFIYADQFSYQNNTLSVTSSEATLSEVFDIIGLASGKNITLTGDSIPSKKLNIRFHGESLDKGLNRVLLEAGVGNFTIGYNGNSPEISSNIKISLTKDFTPSTQATVAGYLNERLGSHVNLLWMSYEF